MKIPIKELAKMTGLTTRTLRYYDQIGLLSAKRDRFSSYRYYTQSDIDCLERILIYRSLGVELHSIKSILLFNKEEEHHFLTEHVKKLIDKRKDMESQIKRIKSILNNKEGVNNMNKDKKFESLKKTIIEENDARYKDEVISKYGENKYSESVKKFAGFTEEDLTLFNRLDSEIKHELRDALNKNLNEKSIECQQIAKKHQDFIRLAWSEYSTEAHLSLCDMYLQDDRFMAHYNEYHNGACKLLRDSVYYLLTEGKKQE